MKNDKPILSLLAGGRRNAVIPAPSGDVALVTDEPQVDPFEVRFQESLDELRLRMMGSLDKLTADFADAREKQTQTSAWVIAANERATALQTELDMARADLGKTGEELMRVRQTNTDLITILQAEREEKSHAMEMRLMTALGTVMTKMQKPTPPPEIKLPRYRMRVVGRDVNGEPEILFLPEEAK